MVIHMFGAYFGLAVARCLFKKGHIDNPAEGGVKQYLKIVLAVGALANQMALLCAITFQQRDVAI